MDRVWNGGEVEVTEIVEVVEEGEVVAFDEVVEVVVVVEFDEVIEVVVVEVVSPILLSRPSFPTSKLVLHASVKEVRCDG